MTALLKSTQVPPIVISERLMILRLPLAKNRFATFVSVYVPTLDSSDDVKDCFYDTLYSTLQRILRNDKITLLGDFNTRVGRNHDIWQDVIGNHVVGMQLTTKTSERNCATSLPNLCPIYQRLLHQTALQTFLWGGRLFPQSS